eukprot:m.221182 g.221182  ORF g.221182 m.221182 type:complete len:58 (+) comp15126_c2_seq7:158-331(+)
MYSPTDNVKAHYNKGECMSPTHGQNTTVTSTTVQQSNNKTKRVNITCCAKLRILGEP